MKNADMQKPDFRISVGHLLKTAILEMPGI